MLVVALVVTEGSGVDDVDDDGAPDSGDANETAVTKVRIVSSADMSVDNCRTRTCLTIYTLDHFTPH